MNNLIEEIERAVGTQINNQSNLYWVTFATDYKIQD